MSKKQEVKPLRKNALVAMSKLKKSSYDFYYQVLKNPIEHTDKNNRLDRQGRTWQEATEQGGSWKDWMCESDPFYAALEDALLVKELLTDKELNNLRYFYTNHAPFLNGDVSQHQLTSILRDVVVNICGFSLVYMYR